MAFWDNVAAELDYRGMTGKALAEQAGFAASSIGKGIRLGSAPSVETAVRIARVLGVSVEYLAADAERSAAAAVTARTAGSAGTGATHAAARTAGASAAGARAAAPHAVVSVEELRLCHRYARFLADLDALPKHEREAVVCMVRQMRGAQEEGAR